MIRTLLALALATIFAASFPASLNAQNARNLPAVWKLPPLDDTSTAKLVDLPGEPADPVSLELRSDVADLPAKAVIRTVAAPDRLSWRIVAIDDPAAKAPRTVHLATITRQEQSLFLAWTQPLASPVLRRQVANCQLDIRIGADSSRAIRGTVQLREPAVQPTYVLDLDEPYTSFEFELTDLPKARHLRLVLRDAKGLRTGSGVRAGSDSVAINKRATIDVADLPGAEIRAIMQPLPNDRGLAVIIKPVFRESKDSEFDLNFTAFENLVEAAKETADRGPGVLANAKRQLDKIESDIKELQRNRPSNIAAVNGWERALAALAPQYRVASKQVGIIAAQIAAAEAREKAAPKVLEILQKLHKQATVEFAICAESGEHDVVLAEASGEPQP